MARNPYAQGNFLDAQGNPIKRPTTDAQGNPLLDAQGNPLSGASSLTRALMQAPKKKVGGRRFNRGRKVAAAVHAAKAAGTSRSAAAQGVAPENTGYPSRNRPRKRVGVGTNPQGLPGR
jgi:hypothetical protein